MKTCIYLCSNDSVTSLAKMMVMSLLENGNVPEDVDIIWFRTSRTIPLRHKQIKYRFAKTTTEPNISNYPDPYFYGICMKVFGLQELWNEYDRILYFDVDVIINGSIEPLLNLDMQGKLMAGVADFPYDKWEAMGREPKDYMVILEKSRRQTAGEHKRYLNAGMHVWDSRQPFTFPDFNKYIVAADINPDFPFYDEDYWNHIFCGQTLLVDSTYNFMLDQIYTDEYTFTECIEWSKEMANAVVQHFHCRAKPWRLVGNEIAKKKMRAMLYTKQWYHYFDQYGANDPELHQAHGNRYSLEMLDNVTDRMMNV